MKKFLLVLSFFLLSAGVAIAQWLPAPADLLREAVERYERCGFKAEEGKFDKNDVLDWKPLKESQRKMVEDLFLPLLFREGRFATGNRVVRTEHKGRSALIVSFVPRPDADQLKRDPKENAKSAKVMNNLSGHLLIDEETREIVNLKAEFVGSIGMRWMIVFPWTLESLNVEMSQVRDESYWRPDKFFMTASGSWLGARNFFKQYRAQFVCDRS